MSIAEPPAGAGRRPRSRPTSASQRGSALSRGRSGRPTSTSGAGDRDDVGRVAVVRERRRAAAPRRGDENARRSATVASGIAPDPRTTSPAGRSASTSARSRAPNGVSSGGPATIRTSSVAARPPRSRRMPLGERESLVADPALERAGARARLRVEDDDDHTGHRPESSERRGRDLTRRVRAYVGLGANLGDAEATLAAAVHALGALPGARLRGVSRLYATAPVGVVDQPEFRNAAVALDVPAGPDPATGALALLVALKALERAFGRRRRERWGPRELDLDLLVFGRAAIAVERPPEARSADPAKPTDLVVPHRLAGERLFVLAPLADLAPRLVPPGWHETVETARRRRELLEGPEAVRPLARWAGGGWVALGGPRPA